MFSRLKSAALHRPRGAVAGSILVAALPGLLGAQEPPGEPGHRHRGLERDKSAAVRDTTGRGWLEGQHMTGGWAGGREQLEGRGVTLLVTSVTDGSIGWAARRRSASALRSLVTVSAALDLAPAFGWRGGRALLQVQARPGGYRPALVGELQGTTNIDAPSYARVAEAWLEQRAGALRLKAGRIDLATEVGLISPAEEFLNPSFAVSPTQPGFPTFPDPRPGAVGELGNGAPSLRLAAFAVEPGSLAPDFGYAELDLRHGSTRGALGAWHRRPGGDLPRRGLQLVLERGGRLASGRTLDGFLRFGWSARGSGVRAHHAAGLVSNAAGRAVDLAGIAWTHVVVDGGAATLEESILELFYAWRAAPWLELRPDLQLVRGPGVRGSIATLRLSICH
jgi:porin